MNQNKLDLTKINMFNIFQWNARSLKPKWPEITNFFSTHNIHLGIIQETWLNGFKKLNDTNYTVITVNRYDSYGGVAFIVHKSINFKVIKTYNDNTTQLLAITILNFKCPLSIYNIYCTKGNITSSFWKEYLFSTGRTTNDYTMLCGDFNAHHPYWDNQKADKRGNDIFRAYFESNYILLNNQKFTTTPQLCQQASTIDLSFPTPKIHSLLRQ